ncbi:MAG: protein-disulfide reductase DsbD [Gammaproteobacteria bacterium]|nr:protein-disulfide reductase DsbD [Gammaproteobacteria bacterium]NNL63350.1 protein-disulfide reductase DsbD [Woeseiaceae bacterium]
MRKFLAVLTALLLFGPAAAEDELVPVTEAFRYVVSDASDAFEVDWSIYEHAYLYKNKLAFESGTKTIVLGEPELPRGIDHEDEFFGKQEIYRDFFFVRVPYTVRGERPETADLIIKSQGCDDNIGLCYPPQKWTETVSLQAAAAQEPGLQLGDLAGAGMNEFPPADEVFFPEAFALDGNAVDVGIRIMPGFYIYKSKLSVRALNNDAQAGGWDLPQGTMKTDEFFGEQEVYLDSFIAQLAIARATPEAMELELELGYQGCAEGGLCYLPQTRVLTVSLPEATTVGALPAAADAPAPQSEQARLANILTGESIWKALAIFFAFGLALAFTPCVLPMIPILSGIIAGEGDDVTPTRGFTLALSYVLGMAIVYTAAGVAAAAAGMQLQATFNQPWVLILFSTLFVVLAFGMFGVYELQMPSGVQTKLSGISGNQKSGTMVGAFIMGGLSALIVTACVAPVLIAALMVIAQTGDLVRGGAGLFAMSLGMGAPLLLVGAAQGRFLPKAGPWMVAIRNAFGFMMLGLAIWMLSRILPGNVTMLLWAVLIFMAGVFMGGLTTLTNESSAAQKLGKGFGFLAIVYGLVLLLGALAGGSNPLKPLAGVGFGGGTVLAEAQHELPFQRIKTIDDLDSELAAASRQGKTAFLDFYADWCVSCKEMEAYTFTDEAVQATLSNTVWLQADVTANDEADQALLERFGVFGPPTIIFFGTDGAQRHGYEVVGYMKAADFAAHVEKALR